MSNIYLVVRSIDYEGTFPFRAFADEMAAHDFCQKVTDYEKTIPPYADDESEYDAWDAAYSVWIAAHPAPEDSRGDSYYVYAMELIK